MAHACSNLFQRRAKYKLKQLVRTQCCDDDSYKAVYECQDDTGRPGVELSKQIVKASHTHLHHGLHQGLGCDSFVFLQMTAGSVLTRCRLSADDAPVMPTNLSRPHISRNLQCISREVLAAPSQGCLCFDLLALPLSPDDQLIPLHGPFKDPCGSLCLIGPRFDPHRLPETR